jgi:aldose 1-epimerase
MALTGQQFTIAAGKHKATVVEVGAGLRRYTHGGVDVTGHYGKSELPPKGCGCTLVPWPNRLRGGTYTFDGVTYQLALTEPAAGNAIHGLGRWARWTHVGHKADRVTLALDIVPQTGYPFQVSVEVTYSLHRRRGLLVTATARNNGTARAPFGAGFHPYLATRGRPLDETTVKVPASKRLVLDDARIPVGVESVSRTPLDLRRGRRLGVARFDDGLTGLTLRDGRAVCEVRNRDGGAQLWVDETWPYLQVFTLDDLAGRPGVAIEPMTCAPNAFNSGDGLIVLEPRATWTGSWGVTPL